MSVTYGFYNSKNHDRKYNAIQMSSIFDGIIRDGIFMSIGACFVVEATGEDMLVRVGEGRAWFDHTWTLNDSLLPLEVPQAEIILNRIDAVVLETNQDREVRANTIKIVKGVPSSNPVRPEMIRSISVNQYPLAFIRVDKGVTSIRQADVTNMVGSSSTPYVTGILETVNIEAMVAQWEDQWVKWLAEKAKDFADADEAHQAQIEQWTEDFSDYISSSKESFDAMIEEQLQIMLDTKTEWNNTWLEWFGQYTSNNETAFDTWFENLQAMLDSNVAANLAAEILKLQGRADKLEQFREDLLIDHSIYDPIMDQDGEAIQDGMGNDIFGRTIFMIKGDTVGSGSDAQTFPSTLDEYYERLDKFADVEIRRGIFRGKCLNNISMKECERIKNGIRNGTFDGLFIGDYIEMPFYSPRYMIADMVCDISNGNWISLVPATVLNKSESEGGGYVLCETGVGFWNSSYRNFLDGEYSDNLNTFLNSKQNLPFIAARKIRERTISNVLSGFAIYTIPPEGIITRPMWHIEVMGYGYSWEYRSCDSIGFPAEKLPLYALKPDYLYFYNKDDANVKKYNYSLLMDVYRSRDDNDNSVVVGSVNYPNEYMFRSAHVPFGKLVPICPLTYITAKED